MIHIEQNQKIAENDNLRVATTTGDYPDDALIECYDVHNEALIVGSFQAQYVQYGGIVYQCNSPLELGEALLKIDPASTHTATSYVKMNNELLSKMNGGTLELESLDEVILSEHNAISEKIDTNSSTHTENTSEVPETTPIAVTQEAVPVDISLDSSGSVAPAPTEQPTVVDIPPDEGVNTRTKLKKASSK